MESSPAKLHTLAGALAETRAELDRVASSLRRTEAEHRRLELMVGSLSAQLREKEEQHLDILERLQQREEEALRRSEERFQLILDSAAEGIQGLDAEGRTIFVNPAAARMTGWQQEEFAARTHHEMLHHHYADGQPYPVEECPIYLTATTGQMREVDSEVFWRKDGTSFPVDYASTPIREGGRIAGVVVVFRNITERKRIEAERLRVLEDLRESVRARDDFLAIAAHELRTPLTPIALQIQLLQRLQKTNPESVVRADQLATSLAMMKSQSDRLARLIDQLLDISRITVGSLKLQREQVDLSELAREVAARLKEESRRKSTQISVHADHSVPGHWDRLRLDQVLTNLYTNAMKYGEGKPVEVRIERLHDRARVSVQDHGIGIAEEDIPRLFRRFQRLVSVRHYGGFGLGLWIVKAIIDAHGGSISVESHLGEGSTFTVELPVQGSSDAG